MPSAYHNPLSCFAALAVFALSIPAPAFPAPAADPPSALAATPAASSAASAARAMSRTRVLVLRGNEESTSKRERRLKRECRGRPNAGACLGFAS